MMSPEEHINSAESYLAGVARIMNQVDGPVGIHHGRVLTFTAMANAHANIAKAVIALRNEAS